MVPPSLQQAAVDKRKSGASSNTPVVQADVQDSGSNGASPTNKANETPYHRIDACSVSFLMEHILEFCEPGTLSVPNLRRMLTRGKAQANKEVMQKLVEMVTGMSPDTALSGKLADLQNFKAYCKSCHEARGRRGRDLTLPPNWQEDGIYSIAEVRSSGVVVHHKFTGAVAMIELDKVPPFKCLQDLYINANWSETRATISSTRDEQGQSCVWLISFFGRQVLKNEPRHSTAGSPSPKRLKAVADGDVSGGLAAPKSGACQQEAPQAIMDMGPSDESGAVDSLESQGFSSSESLAPITPAKSNAKWSTPGQDSAVKSEGSQSIVDEAFEEAPPPMA